MPARERLKLYIASLRLDRWPRSLAILLGFAAVFIIKPELLKSFGVLSLFKLVLAFLLTWMVSTANYIVNEITDAPYDAFHPDKRHRPLVKKEIKKQKLIIFWLILVIISFSLAMAFFNLFFLASLSGLLLAGLLYNVPPIRVKDIPYLDSTLESANNPIRFLIGWYVLATAFPPWTMLLAWWAFGNFLMVGKRVAEKKFLTAEESSGYRRSLNKYSSRGLIVFMAANGLLFLVSFFLFGIRFRLQTVYFSLPLLVGYLAIFMIKSIQDREAAEEPEKLLRNPFFAIYTLVLAIILALTMILK